MAVNEIFFDRYPDSILEHQIQVRPFNALKTKNMRNLNPEGTVFPPVLVRYCWHIEGNVFNSRKIPYVRVTSPGNLKGIGNSDDGGQCVDRNQEQAQTLLCHMLVGPPYIFLLVTNEII